MSILQGFLHWIPSGLPAYLFIITVVVFFHELGHFLVARSCGIAVETFSIGFGGEIVGWTDGHGTRWKISWIPFGGYVKFLGDAGAASTPDRETLENLTPEQRERTFTFKPLGQRAMVAAAGPFANFILATVIFFFAFWANGDRGIAPVVNQVMPGSAAAAAGFQHGDIIKSVDGNPVVSFFDLKDYILMDTGSALAFGVDRGGRLVTLHAMPRLMEQPDPFGGKDRVLTLGVTPIVDAAHLVHIEYGPVGAMGAALNEVWTVVSGTLTYVWQMFTGYADTSQLRGPLGMASVSQKVAAFGFGALLRLAALLSVSIGLINLFPIPLLDGGHLLYYAFEAVLGRPLGVRVQDVGFRVGLALVLGLMILVTWNDVARLNLF